MDCTFTLIFGIILGVLIANLIHFVATAVVSKIKNKTTNEINIGDIFIRKCYYNDPFRDNSDVNHHRKIIDFKTRDGVKYVKYSTFYGEESETVSYFLEFNTKYKAND